MSKNSLQGFTLVEMIVAMGLFAIVMFIATGALLSLIAINRKAQAQQVAINNINFVMESITRNIRVGSVYHCEDTTFGWAANYDVAQDCASGGNLMAFTPPLDISTGLASPIRVYKFITLAPSAVPNAIGVCSVDAGVLCTTDADFSPLTAPEITIDMLRFIVTGTTPSSQPLVRVNVSGHAITDEVNNPRRVNFYIQSGGSQRLLNLP